MYRFKFYYKDGTEEVSNFAMENAEDLYIDFDGLIDWNEYYSFDELKPDISELLEVARRAYTGFYKDFYRIEIIDDLNNKVIGFINEDEVICKNMKRKKIIDRLNREDWEEKNREMEPSNLNYRFKFYFNNGTFKEIGGATSPTSLIFLLDEYIDLSKINFKNLTANTVLKMAKDVYKNILDDFYRIEIINDKTNEVICFINDRNP